MNIKIIESKNIITKSNIPGIDYVINPFVGCQHGCIYCYAEFMKRFTNHGGDDWGKFIDIKKFDLSTIKPEKYTNKTLLFSSVTDPYCPIEAKYKITRSILEKLVGTKAKIDVLTKSRLVERDIDLFQLFENIRVGISLSTLDTNHAKKIEPLASRPELRIKALENIANKGIATYVFISPIFPEITDWKEIILATKHFTTDFMFENLNFRAHNIRRIMNLIIEQFPHLFDFYEEIRIDPTLWDPIENEIVAFCKIHKLNCQVAFHHGGFKK
ncbi:MAG TPA: radical SAM protein [Candidatus Bathyarchaeia archaeon]|nr:radical SAM protein [Candidatus Bathyarchaeia archaeon]